MINNMPGFILAHKSIFFFILHIYMNRIAQSKVYTLAYKSLFLDLKSHSVSFVLFLLSSADIYQFSSSSWYSKKIALLGSGYRSLYLYIRRRIYGAGGGVQHSTRDDGQGNSMGESNGPASPGQQRIGFCSSITVRRLYI